MVSRIVDYINFVHSFQREKKTSKDSREVPEFFAYVSTRRYDRHPALSDATTAGSVIGSVRWASQTGKLAQVAWN
jgi:hypothetical protein